MKNPIRNLRRGAVAFAALAPLLAVPSLLEAQLVDNFEDATLGNLVGQNTGTGGWLTGWQSNPANLTNVQVIDTGANPLGYAPNDAPPVSGGPQAIQITGNGDNIAFRQLPPQDGDEVYLRFLIRLETGFDITNNDFCSFWFDNVTSGNHTNVPSLGLKANQGTGSGPLDFQARLQLNQETYFVDAVPGGLLLDHGALAQGPPRGGQ